MNEILFEIGINLVETLILTDFITKYLGAEYRGIKKYIGFIAAWMLCFAELCIINHIYVFEGAASLIPIFITFIYSMIFLKGGILLKLWVSALAQMIIMVIAIGTNLVICQIIGYNPNDMISVFNSTRIIGVIITKVIFFYVTRMILRNRYKNPLDVQAWIMLILIPIISLVSLSALMMAAINHEEISEYIIIGMTGILLANIVTYYLFSKLNKDYEIKLKVKLLEQNYENAVKNIESSETFVEQMRTVRHDIRNQLLMISDYISNEKYDEAKNHLEAITESYLPDSKTFIHSKNEAFNAIVNSKIAVCNQKKIYILVKEMEDALNGFDPIDTGVIFGNLIDNAIEAAEKTKHRKITVDVCNQEGYLSILLTNSIAKSVIENNKELSTTKKDKMLHGIGIRSVKKVVKKYDGMIDFYENGEEFCCHILMDTGKA